MSALHGSEDFKALQLELKNERREKNRLLREVRERDNTIFAFNEKATFLESLYKKTKEQKEEQDRYLHLMLDNSQDIILLLDADGKFISGTRNTLRWIGINPDSLTGNDFYSGFSGVLPQESLEKLKSQFQAVLEKGEASDYNFALTLDNGKTYYFAATMIPIKDETGAVIGTLLQMHDVTEMQKAVKAERDANESKSNFLAKMSHEIRTPMNAIMGLSELVLREEVSGQAYNYTKSIKEAANNLLSIINDILDISKIESGKLEITEAEYQLSSLVNDVINIVCVKLTETPLAFTVNIDSAIPALLMGDETRIRQVLINLLGNAVKYTRHGFVSINIGEEKRENNKILLRIEIADSGIGIRPEDIDKLFSDFIQVDTATNRNIQGTGLGLAIVKNLCIAMGGDISVSSQYGKGSRFTILLPQHYFGDERIAFVPKPPEKGILLYEQREIYADSIIRTINNLGVECTHAKDENAFYRALKNSNYPFIFVSSALYKDSKKTAVELGVDQNIVLLMEFGEHCAEKSIKTIQMPVHSISIANILNNAGDNTGYGNGYELNQSFSAPSAKVLVVDDIPTNLTVMEGLMAPYNMQVDTCTSGEASIEKIKKVEYDIVFMDHMMPDMDGIETAKIIREMEGKYFQSVPIIALTANAVSGVREKYLLNGMDDYLSKPVKLSKLDSVLERWIPKEKKEMPSGRKTGSAVPPAPFAIEGVDINAGIAVAGLDIKRYRWTLSIFQKDGLVKAGQIRDCLEGGDMRLFITYVHALKTALHNIGARELSAFAETLEAAGNRGDMARIEKDKDLFLERLETLLKNISKALSASQEENSPKGRIDETQLTMLKKALDEMDAAVIDTAINKLRFANPGGEANLAIEDIYQNILLFEYDKAQLLIDELLAGPLTGETAKPGNTQ